MTDRVAVMIAAQAVALSARTGTLTLHAVDDMRARAEQFLDWRDDVRLAVMTFATQYEQHRRDPEALRALGEALDAAICQILRLTEAPVRHRRDVDD